MIRVSLCLSLVNHIAVLLDRKPLFATKLILKNNDTQMTIKSRWFSNRRNRIAEISKNFYRLLTTRKWLTRNCDKHKQILYQYKFIWLDLIFTFDLIWVLFKKENETEIKYKNWIGDHFYFLLKKKKKRELRKILAFNRRCHLCCV